MSTTSYGSWGQYRSYQTLEDEIAVILGSEADEYDIDAIVAAYRQAINDALPDGVSLNGNELHGPCDQRGEWTIWFNADTLSEAADVDVDFWEIAARYEIDPADVS